MTQRTYRTLAAARSWTRAAGDPTLPPDRRAWMRRRQAHLLSRARAWSRREADLHEALHCDPEPLGAPMMMTTTTAADTLRSPLPAPPGGAPWR